jgi:hypothetical protein
MRGNPDIVFEKEFQIITCLDRALGVFCKSPDSVRITNDGNMGAFTAAVEKAWDGQDPWQGMFVHTLGTELGTGWIQGNGVIPEIPLEAYNCIVDLGSFPEQQFDCDDVRSVINFNTGLSGTLQKYASQSGVFRLAAKYFPTERPDLFARLLEKGFITAGGEGGVLRYVVPTAPVDKRKPFLEYMMLLAETENDAVNRKIWLEVGKSLGAAWIETERIAPSGIPVRILFGRLIKRKKCFDLLAEGAKEMGQNIKFEAADASFAASPLMKQLERTGEYTVAQFAQTIGALYFTNWKQEDEL